MLNEIIVSVASTIIIALIGYVAHALVGLLNGKLNETQRNLLNKIIQEGIHYADQTVEQGNNNTKLFKCKNFIRVECAKIGIKVSDTQIESLIESVLKQLKLNFPNNK